MRGVRSALLLTLNDRKIYRCENQQTANSRTPPGARDGSARLELRSCFHPASETHEPSQSLDQIGNFRAQRQISRSIHIPNCCNAIAPSSGSCRLSARVCLRYIRFSSANRDNKSAASKNAFARTKSPRPAVLYSGSSTPLVPLASALPKPGCDSHNANRVLIRSIFRNLLR